MCLSRDAVARRLDQARRYELEHKRERAVYKRAWQRTPLGKLSNNLRQAEWQYRRRPTQRLAARIAALTAEIERLRGDA